jgi:DNA (cytosine-5)-methyltransferase 1
MSERLGLRSVELFGGAGGLALGTHAAGFSTELFLEWNKWACATARTNKASHASGTEGWNIVEGDVREFNWSSVIPPIDLVSGGPPCQPFSMGGKAGAAEDSRDMFPAAVEVIRHLEPKAVLLENVKGLTRSSFSEYFELICLRLRFPDVRPHGRESWQEHLSRLRKVEKAGGSGGLEYVVRTHLLNAADYGVPQQRHRVFFVCFRRDLDVQWTFPRATHSEDALLASQWISGDYWDEHKVAEKDRPLLPERKRKRIQKIADENTTFSSARWRTVRDALRDMPEPWQQPNGTPGWYNHVYQGGARTYPGHTGSEIDLPAKTLKAGGHGVPGGENMLRENDGSVRYFSVRESARLQTFPDDYQLNGSWGEAMRQIGNAVPVKLAETMAGSIATAITSLNARQEHLLSA